MSSNISKHRTVTAAERTREFWCGVLLAGGFTALPRWSCEVVAGVGEHEARIPDELVAANRPRQGAWRTLGRARGMHWLCPGTRIAVATSDDACIPLVARGATG